jgi:ribosomal protein S18 acetylase RimI-like enzyme
VWLAEDGGTPAGYAVTTWGWSLESGGLECLLDELYVRRRGTGLGAMLLRHAMAAARTAGAAAMFLETEAPNAAARRFYVRHGFAVEDSVWLSTPLC